MATLGFLNTFSFLILSKFNKAISWVRIKCPFLSNNLFLEISIPAGDINDPLGNSEKILTDLLNKLNCTYSIGTTVSEFLGKYTTVGILEACPDCKGFILIFPSLILSITFSVIGFKFEAPFRSS